jgi:hypothetical protein
MSNDWWYQPGGLFGGNEADEEEEVLEAVEGRFEELGLKEEVGRYRAAIFALDEKIKELNGQLLGLQDEQEAAKLRADVAKLFDKKRLLRTEWKVKCSDAEAASSAKLKEEIRKRMSDPTVKKKQEEIERYVRAKQEQLRRRGKPSGQLARTKAKSEMGGERLWNLFAEKRGGPFLKSGSLKYEVWADTLKNAKFFASKGEFANSSTDRGIRSITSGESVEQAPYLKGKAKRKG